jgi:flagellar protein FliO/FliZ
MKSLTFTRGACLACAFSILLALAMSCAAPAFAGTGTSTNAESNTSTSFEGTHLHLQSSSPNHASSGSFGGTVARTIVGLLIVIAVIYGLSWILRQARSARNPSTGDGLAQISSLPLGANRSVALVRVGAELHLLGVAEHGVTSIRVFSEEEAYELGLPFDPEDIDTSGGIGGLPPVQRVVSSLRRFTVR